MSSNLVQRDTRASVFRPSDASRRNGLSTPAPWSKLSWSFFLPLVFVGNVVVAVLVWFVVELVMR